MDVRGGVNYYHNIAISQGAGLTTSTDIGIPGANIDEFTSGLSRFTIGGYTAPLLGFSPSLPWDRSETTWNFATTVTKLVRSAHREDRRRVAPQSRHAAADAGRRRLARPVQLQRVGHRPSHRCVVADRRCQFVRVVPARLAERRHARPQGHRRARHAALGGVPLHAGQVAGAAEPHHRPRLALGVLHAAQWPRRRRQPFELRPGHQHAARRRLRHDERIVERQEHVHELQPADGRVVAAGREDGAACGLRREHDSRSRTTATRSTTRSSRTTRARWPTGSRPPARWRPASRRRRWWTSRRTASSRCPARSSTRRSTSSPGPARSHAALVERRRPAAVAVQPHGRHRLRRQPRRRSGHGRRRQREPRLRLGQRRPPAVRAYNRTGTTRIRSNDEQVGVQRAADEGRPPLLERPADHELVHAEPLDGPREREHDASPRQSTST